MTPFQKWLLLISSFLTGATGVLYWIMDRFLEPLDPWAVINHPWQPVVLKLHILVAPVLVFAIGLIASDHIWRHLRGPVRIARRTGVVTFLVLGPMVASGYLVQAVTAPAWLNVVAWVHLVTGAAYLGGLILHQAMVVRRRMARAQAPAVYSAPSPEARTGRLADCVGTTLHAPSTQRNR